MSRGPPKRQQPPSYMSESSVLCRHCGKNIIANNYLIHQARCGLMSSRVYNQKPEIKPERQRPSYIPNQPSFRQTQIKKEEIKPPSQNRGSISRERNKIFNKKQQRSALQQEKIPCHFCGYMQTLNELDSHPKECEHREQQCPECGGNFPRSLMGEHHQVCRNISRQRQNPNYQDQPWFQNHQQEQDYDPFGNFSNFFQFGRGNQRPRLQMQQRQMNPQRNINEEGYTVIQRTDRHGNVIREVIMNNPQGFMSSRRQPGYQSPYSPFTNFFALLQLMAGRHAHQNQGLTKEEIKALKKVKYQGNNTLKKENQKDLCTICYCEFQKDEKLVQLRCKHMYHQECITKWVETTAKCPVCKAPQTDRQIFSQEDDM